MILDHPLTFCRRKALEHLAKFRPLPTGGQNYHARAVALREQIRAMLPLLSTDIVTDEFGASRILDGSVLQAFLEQVSQWMSTGVKDLLVSFFY